MPPSLKLIFKLVSISDDGRALRLRNSPQIPQEGRIDLVNSELPGNCGPSHTNRPNPSQTVSPPLEISIIFGIF